MKKEVEMKSQIKIEMNPNLKDDVILVECGAKAYEQLPTDLTQRVRICDEMQDMRWYIKAYRRATQKPYYVQINEGVLRFRKFLHSATSFHSYTEAREVADRLVKSLNFDRILIVEEIHSMF
jgi:hypothetical protein